MSKIQIWNLSQNLPTLIFIRHGEDHTKEKNRKNQI